MLSIGPSRRLRLWAAGITCALATASPHAMAGGDGTNLTAGPPPGPAAADVEVEPQVAAVPGDSTRIAVGWNQLLADGGWDIVVALSTDAGSTWTQLVVPQMDNCALPVGGPGQSGLPSLSYGPDGRLYVAALCYVPSTTHNEQLVTTLSPGGTSWTTPTDLGSGTRGRVIADPKVAGAAYIAYLSAVAADTAHSVLVRRTVDGGRTWLPATTAYASQGDDAYTADIAITGHAPRGGPAQLIVALHGGIDLNTCCTFTMAVRSDDGGAHWGAVERVPNAASDANDIWPQDPEPSLDPTDGSAPYGTSGPPIRVTAGKDGTAFVVWSTVDAKGKAQLLVSSSSARNQWSDALPINSTSARAFEPQIAVTRNGTLSVTWYDDRKDEPSDAAWTVDVWQATSRDGGRSWSESHLAGPMDIRPAVEQYAFSDYFGVAAVGDEVLAAYVATAGVEGTTAATEGLTDVYLTRTHP